jgi:hypothetical protein
MWCAISAECSADSEERCVSYVIFHKCGERNFVQVLELRSTRFPSLVAVVGRVVVVMELKKVCVSQLAYTIRLDYLLGLR